MSDQIRDLPHDIDLEVVDLECEKAKRFELTVDGKVRRRGDSRRKSTKSKICSGVDFGLRESREADYSDAFERLGRPKPKPMTDSDIVIKLSEIESMLARGDLDQAREAVESLSKSIATGGSQ